MTQVTIYTRALCSYCAAAKQLLDKKQVTYDERNASQTPQLRQEMIARANGRTTFPQIFIGNLHVGGCDDLYALERGGRLDALLAETGE